MIKSIKITKLFGIFDYTIELSPDKPVQIITGPNGYGKTSILNILHGLATKDTLFFVSINFKSIEISFADHSDVLLSKYEDDDGSGLVFKKGSSTVHLTSKELSKTVDNIFRQASDFFQKESAQRKYDSFGNSVQKKSFEESIYDGIYDNMKASGVFTIFDSLTEFDKVHLITAQRILTHVTENKSNADSESHVFEETYTETIEEYCDDLKSNIVNLTIEYSEIAQELDSSFPTRLFTVDKGISEERFDERFQKVKAVQKRLNRFGILSFNEDNHPAYQKDNAKALKVYIDDTEKKLHVFDELLQKLELFVSILNERRFAFKKIKISKEVGFIFTTIQENDISLSFLSSGEKQEVILLYELLFKIEEGALVLIDEPEISLHVAWQKAFLADVEKIARLQKFNVVVATHSPQIINGNWDITIDLEDLNNVNA